MSPSIMPRKRARIRRERPPAFARGKDGTGLENLGREDFCFDFDETRADLDRLTILCQQRLTLPLPLPGRRLPGRPQRDDLAILLEIARARLEDWFGPNRWISRPKSITALVESALSKAAKWANMSESSKYAAMHRIREKYQVLQAPLLEIVRLGLDCMDREG